MLPRTAAALTICSILTALAAGGAQAGPNLVTNPDAETGDLTAWMVVAGGFAVQDGTGSTPVHAGGYSFWAGLFGPSGAYDHEMRQDVDVTAYAAAIDAGQGFADFSAWARSNEFGGFVDAASVMVEYRDAAVVLQAYASGPATPVNAWVLLQDSRPIPVGTRVIRIRLVATRPIGQSTDAFFDDLGLVLSSATGAAEPDVELASWGVTKGRFGEGPSRVRGR